MPPVGRLRPWLTDRGSLTARIVAHFDDFNLVRLGQSRQKPQTDERRALCLRAGQLAMIREVLLRSGEAQLVFAHTVVNPADLRGAWRGLSKLGARPLAEMLFHDPLVSRMPMEYRWLSATHPLVKAAGARTGCWARRSVFLKSARPLLVTEVFLPTLEV